MKIFYLTLFLILSCTHSEIERKIASQNHYGWKLTFEDNFESKEKAIAKGAKAECFEGPIACNYYGWRVSECDETHLNPGMRNFNRCNWHVWGGANWMGQGDWGAGEGLNSFHPKAVDIINDKLYLMAVRSDVPKEGQSCRKMIKNPLRPQDEGKVEDNQCLVWSGGIGSTNSTYFNSKMLGFSQEYGRFEIRAKISYGPGSWPAHWLLPQRRPENLPAECHIWPYGGEIDIMEAWEDHPTRYSTVYHGGVCRDRLKYHSKGDHYATRHLFPDLSRRERKEAFYKRFHTYAVEWEKDHMTFYFNEHKVYELKEGQLVRAYYNEGENKGQIVADVPLEIPKGAFNILLNNTISRNSRAAWEKLAVGESAGEDLDHIIDYVKVYQRCTEEDDPKDCYFPQRADITADIKLYPNPIKRHRPLNVEFIAHHDCDQAEFQILSRDGKTMPQQIISQQKTQVEGYSPINLQVDTNQLTAGSYFFTSLISGCTQQKIDARITEQFIVVE